MKIEILDAAENDSANGICFYESQSVNLGNYFLDSILSDIDFCPNDSHLPSMYKVNDDFVYVYAVLDCRQHPSWIDARLS